MTHRLFADDILLFIKANWKYFLAIKRMIQEFLDFLGLHINTTKSLVILSASCNNKEELMGILDYSEGTFPLKYIGVPITPHELCAGECDDLVGHIRSYLS